MQLVSEDAALWPLAQDSPAVLTGPQLGEGKELEKKGEESARKLRIRGYAS